MKSTKLTVRLTANEQKAIGQKFAGKNVSNLVRKFLLGDQAEPRLSR